MSKDRSGDIEIIRQIDAYLKGELSPEKAEQLWVELIKHPEYLDYFETEISLKTALDTGKDSTPAGSAGLVQSSYLVWVATAAAVALLIVALNIFMTGNQQPLRELALSEITIADNLESPPVFRSQKSTLSPADSLLNLGFEAALSGDLNRALRLYKSVVDRFESDPSSGRAYLNIGIIRYNRGEYRTAAASFNRAIEQVDQEPVLEEKAYWYLGNAYIYLQEPAEAREAIHRAYRMDGIYRNPAFRLLRKLDYELGNIDFEEFDQQTDGG